MSEYFGWILALLALITVVGGILAGIYLYQQHNMQFAQSCFEAGGSPTWIGNTYVCMPANFNAETK